MKWSFLSKLTKASNMKNNKALGTMNKIQLNESVYPCENCWYTLTTLNRNWLLFWMWNWEKTYSLVSLEWVQQYFIVNYYWRRFATKTWDRIQFYITGHIFFMSTFYVVIIIIIVHSFNGKHTTWPEDDSMDHIITFSPIRS